jgi:erythronate-4-phosphate dehydrogenase
MKKRPRIIVDDNIPFIKGRLEPFADTVYADQFGFTPELVRDADAMVIRTRTRCDENLLKGSKVKIIATATIGMDQFDLGWCRDNGITCRNSPGCNAPGVAQYVWSALLRSGFDPERHTLGVVGCGNVGSIVADWGRRLGADVLVNDPPKAAAGASLPGHAELPELLREADAVTLHTPLTRDGEWPSFHLIGEAALALMKPGALLVNAARGPVADNAALRRAVASGHIRAVIDTWEGEPKLDKELLSLLKYGTFHIAGYSLEGKQRATRMALEAIGEHFGFAPDLSGLEGPYKAPARISAKAILDSYNPISDTLQLKADPDAFDTLRANYSFRREPRFI